MRFGPITHDTVSSFRTLSSRMNLAPKGMLILATIQAQVDKMPEKEEIRKKLTRSQTLRIAHFCNFDVDRSLKLMCKVKSRRFHLSPATLKEQLATQTIFPCPGLETRDGSKVFMMRPSRYFPQNTPVSDIIDNLIFVMDHLTQQDFVTEQNGIAFIANMDSWTMKNFSTEYCLKFMMALQGHVFPAKVNLFLIVNPPSWFGKVRIGRIPRQIFSPRALHNTHPSQQIPLFNCYCSGMDDNETDVVFIVPSESPYDR